MPAHKPRIGLALGGGSARGWAHIGVIRALGEAGIRPHMVSGTSVGALVGAVYANGQLDWLEGWVRKLTWQAVVGMLDLSLNGGLLKGDKLIDFFRSQFGDKDMAELELPFAAVATDLRTGREVWLKSGKVMDTVRASIAVPGLFTPAWRNGVWLVDGGLVNPVPVSLARAMGADLVIAVDLNSDIVGKHLRHAAEEEEKEPGLAEKMKSLVQSHIPSLKLASSGATKTRHREPAPSFMDVVETSINIMQVRITRSRLAGEPADVLISPRLGHLGLMDYHRAALAIQEGRTAVQIMLPAIRAQLGLPLPAPA